MRTMVRTDEDFGNWFKDRRKAKGWTQKEASLQMKGAGYGVSRNWVNRVENGAVASDDFHEAAEKLFGRYNAPSVAGSERSDTSELAVLFQRLDRQAELIDALVEQLRTANEDRPYWRSRVIDLEKAVGELTERLHRVEARAKGRVGGPRVAKAGANQ